MRPWLQMSLCLLAVGCISTTVNRVDHAARPARSADSVTVLLAAPAQPHTVIATIEATGNSAFDSFADLRSVLLAEAAQLGGDALILGPASTDERFILTGTAMIKSDRKKLTGAVVVFDGGRRDG